MAPQERELMVVRVVEIDGRIYATASNAGGEGCKPRDYVRAIAELRAMARALTAEVEKQLGTGGAFSLLVQREFMRLVSEKPAIQRAIFQEVPSDGQ